MKKSPIVRYLPIAAEPPSLQDNTADLDRLKKAVSRNFPGRAVVVPFSRLAVVAQRFRQAKFTGIAVVNAIAQAVEIVDFISDETKVLAAMALDLGTTHLEATLIDLQSGERLAAANLENSQAEYGADILSRIHFACRERGLQILHEAIVNDINELASRLAKESSLNISEIRGLSVSGNPTMVHLFLNITPHNLCREPYIPTVNYPDPFRAGELALMINPAAPVVVMPGVGSYFGGDLISGILSTGLDQQEKISMLIDVGTNAEVVLGNKDWLIACAGAAGPALEGGVAKMGMRAAPGAIERVAVDKSSGEFICKTIGAEKPKGLCGSGLIDLVALLYLTRVIDSRGKFRKEAVGGRLSGASDDQVFTVVPASRSKNQEAVLLGQVDLDALMRSKAAMYAILTTLVNQVGVEMDELHRIYVAGAFGRHIDPRQAITLGMLPDLPIETYQPVGNSSLRGAELVLRDQEVVERCRKVVNSITYVELNVNQEFMLRFSGAKFIPHTDSSLFPSVPVFKD